MRTQLPRSIPLGTCVSLTSLCPKFARRRLLPRISLSFELHAKKSSITAACCAGIELHELQLLWPKGQRDDCHCHSHQCWCSCWCRNRAAVPWFPKKCRRATQAAEGQWLRLHRCAYFRGNLPRSLFGSATISPAVERKKRCVQYRASRKCTWTLGLQPRSTLSLPRVTSRCGMLSLMVGQLSPVASTYTLALPPVISGSRANSSTRQPRRRSMLVRGPLSS